MQVSTLLPLNSPTQPSIPTGSVNEYQLRLGRQRLMAHSDCGRTCGCAGKTVKSLENTCHTWALLRWWFTTKRRYMRLYLYPLALLGSSGPWPQLLYSTHHAYTKCLFHAVIHHYFYHGVFDRWELMFYWHSCWQASENRYDETADRWRWLMNMEKKYQI